MALPNGVASGDLTTDSAVLWARSTVVGDVEFAVYEGRGAAATLVDRQIARVGDPNVPAKVTVGGLEPGRLYSYAVTDAEGTSLTGVFSTAAEEGFNGLDFGITGDWRGDLLPYPAIANADEAQLDFFLQGGDTIYADFPSPAAPPVFDLEGFRVKYQEVYGERLGINAWADLRASTGVYATIDDHEVVNDFAGGALAASDERFGTTTGFVNDAAAYEDGLQAFVEYHPIAATFYGNTGDERTAGERELYRNQAFGQDAALMMLDQRSFRDDQIDPVIDRTNVADVVRFQTESFDPTRTLLGETQFATLKADLLAAEAKGITWKIVYSPEPIQDLGLNSADSWEGYKAERTELLKFINENDIDNVVFVAADIHATFVNNLTYSEVPLGPQIATSAFEITTGSVAFSPPFGPAVIDVATAAGLISAEQRAFYDSLPIAPDADDIANDKDDFVTQAFNNLAIAPLGLDPLGLDDNLAAAEGLIDATLLRGDYVSAHTFGWTQFGIDPRTQLMTVTTWGIPAYSQADLMADPDEVLARQPTIVSQFTVAPEEDVTGPIATGELGINLVAEFEGAGGEGASEVVAHDDGELSVTNGALGRIDVFDLAAELRAPASEDDAMVKGLNGYVADAVFTISETLPTEAEYNTLNGIASYTPPGVLDGLGAYRLDADTVRVFANHELAESVGYDYLVSDGAAGSFALDGARISYFDINRVTREIVDSGLAYDTIYDANGDVATNASFLANNLPGFSRFCSGMLIEPEQFGAGRGLADRIYFAGEETGGGFSPTGGAMWALDPDTGGLWHVPDMGRGAWENATEIDTGSTDKVAFILADDTSPFDADGDGEVEAAPLYLYVGTKDPSGDFLAKNGLRDGTLHVFVTESGDTLPSEFNGDGEARSGRWVAIESGTSTSGVPNAPSEDGSTGFDELGYPTQRTLFARAEAVGAFGFSRPEDIATNPANGAEIVLASTGVRGYDVVAERTTGADTFGTVYTVATTFDDAGAPSAVTTTIVYDGNADPDRKLRSPDNLDWADDGLIYVQEDEAEEFTLDDPTLPGDIPGTADEEPLFNEGAVNRNEAGIVRIDPDSRTLTRVANIDRSVVLDFSIPNPADAVDTDAGSPGEWESSGILDVSVEFGEKPGTLFLMDVQAHGIDDQTAINPESRINDDDLVEGGQLLFLEAPDRIDLTALPNYGSVQSVAVANGVVAAAIARTPLSGSAQSLPGYVAFFDAATGEYLDRVDVGNLPDALAFTPDGNTLVVAGEGEFGTDSETVDNPRGTISIIDVSDPRDASATVLDFAAFDGDEDALRAAGVRISDGVPASLDIEPEYVAILDDGATAYVTLQENNAIAVVDIASRAIRELLPAGTVRYGEGGNALDPNDDGKIDIKGFDNLSGLRMPDAIATAAIDGTTYLFMANEGDGRGDFDDGDAGDEARVEDILDGSVAGVSLDPSVETAGLERLVVSTVDGDSDGDGDIDELQAFGSRSFTIFDTEGNVVFDSGSDFERIIARLGPERFNDDDGTGDENRSDNKGPEPEAIAVGKVGGETYAFIGLERDSGVVIYNVSDPEDATFVDYIAPQFEGETRADQTARQGPETITFISARDSETGNAQIAVAYEISGTTAVYELTRLTPVVEISEIQGAGHVSELAGETVRTKGIVTAVVGNGYYLMDRSGDGDEATSDGIFVSTGGAPTVALGDKVRVTGEVQEFAPSFRPADLSVTQIVQDKVVTVSSGNTLPAPTVIGAAGRTPPTEEVISDDELPVNLRTEPGEFDPEEDGIDFYESLEGMLVVVDDPTVVGATSRFDETFVLSDDGANATPGLNDRGGININADPDGYGDLNPERIQLQYVDGLTPNAPVLDVGANLGDVTGIVDYGFGNFEVRVTDGVTVDAESLLSAETTNVRGGPNRLSLASYNLLNVSAVANDDEQIAELAVQIVANLGSPDILALQEIQEDNGEPGDEGNAGFIDANGNGGFDGGEVVIDDGVLGADATLQALADAIVSAGGPSYEFASAEVDEFFETGGVPGGNIRNAFLYNPERVTLEETVTLESDVLEDLGVENFDAFETEPEGARDPLLGVFRFNGDAVTVINNHFSSRFGSEPIFGGPQPFFQAGEDDREAQALAVNEVVDLLLADDPDANVIVAGDLNTFEFTDELTEDLPGVGGEKVLTNLIDRVPEGERYTFIFEGNSQVLDNIFVTDQLLDRARVDIAHVNTDFVDFTSDHEPVVASFRIKGDGGIVIGTPGDDVLTAEPGGVVRGGGGNDVLIGAAGDETLVGGAGDDTINGRPGDDLGIGGAGSDSVFGNTGDDRLVGNTGSDTLTGGAGYDSLFGDGGRDLLSGNRGDDDLRGGDGNDTLHGDGGDTMRGGEGADLFVLTLGKGLPTITDFMLGEDRIALSGGLDFDDLSIVGDVLEAVIGGRVDALAILRDVVGSNVSEEDFIL